MCEICSKVKIKTPNRRLVYPLKTPDNHRLSDVSRGYTRRRSFAFNFSIIAFPLLTFNKQRPAAKNSQQIGKVLPFPSFLRSPSIIWDCSVKTKNLYNRLLRNFSIILQLWDTISNESLSCQLIPPFMFL